MGNTIITDSIKSKSIELVDIDSIQPRPDNRNIHSPEQIERLCKIIEYQGFRDPLIVSNQSGMLVSGHGRLLAAKKMGLKELPITRQDFDTPDQEYAAMVSLNSIASWAELDLSGINADIPDLGPFDIELLGIKDFKLDTAELSDGSDSQTGNLSEKFLIPPFSVLNAREGWWQDRKRQWIAMGIKSELGRGGGATGSQLQKPGTLGCIPPNQKDIMGRKGKYAT